MKISVVLSVFNGEASLAGTLDSILAQTEKDFELIAVDDGSTDGTSTVLHEYAARDPRIRVLTQSNAGLTASLIRGCQDARGTFIARHDAGDTSHPERFARQLAAFSDPEVILTGCAVRFRAPGGERLYDARADGERLRDGLLHGGAAAIRALPHHGSAMFRRDAYLRAGGYRAAFRYAQDLDLWIRLARLGRIVVLPEILYEGGVAAGSLSTIARDEQQSLTQLAVQIRDARDDEETATLLERAAQIMRRPSDPRSRNARAFYFLASCLLRNGDDGWRRYALAALKSNPLHWRTWTLFPRSLWRKVADR